MEQNFNSRPSARGDARGRNYLIYPDYFNSRPSARGDYTICKIWTFAHDFNSRPSARGDAMFNFYDTVIRISIHAPPRGATPFSWAVNCPEGISIHAPPRGATSRGRTSATASAYFNSRPSARGDKMEVIKLGVMLAFQFTPLREGRRRQFIILTPPSLFQFTPLREGRQRCRSFPASSSHFNSRPSARGDVRQDRGDVS